MPAPLARPVIDSHTHTDTVRRYSGLDVTTNLCAARVIGVRGVVQVGCDEPGNAYAVDLARRVPGVIATVALHPNEAADLGDQWPEVFERSVRRLATENAEVRGIGETGLDYFRTTEADGQARQAESFAAHIELARELDRTLVIHDREAHQDVLAVLDRTGLPERIVMHCFSGDAAFARQCLDRGAYLSVPGVITYKSARDQREALAMTPLDRLLVETDAPFLTPVPERGRKNATYLMAHTVRFIAEARGIDEGALCDQLVANTIQAFGGPWGELDPNQVVEALGADGSAVLDGSPV